jgi:Na+-driven multidrug efflux pump
MERHKNLKWTIPVFLESTLFCLLTMVVSRFEISFGADAAAVSRVCSQVESLSWLVGAGFGSAVTSFVGQNYGAGNTERINKGVSISMRLMAGWGLMVSLLMVFGGGVMFSLFLPDPDLLEMGRRYMIVLAVCQIPMNLEAVAGNAFKGRGRTIPPSVASITSNVIRVPMAYFLSRSPLGLAGIWLVISGTACLRGIWISVWHYISYGRRAKCKSA